MGKGIEFVGANQDFKAPKGMTEEQVYTLPTKIGVDEELDNIAVVSCWEFSDEEMAIFLSTKRMYLKVLGGQPAVCLSPSYTLVESVKLVAQDELVERINGTYKK